MLTKLNLNDVTLLLARILCGNKNRNKLNMLALWESEEHLMEIQNLTLKNTQYFLLVLGLSLHHVAKDFFHSVHHGLYFSYNKTKPLKINLKGKVIGRTEVSQCREACQCLFDLPQELYILDLLSLNLPNLLYLGCISYFKEFNSFSNCGSLNRFIEITNL